MTKDEAQAVLAKFGKRWGDLPEGEEDLWPKRAAIEARFMPNYSRWLLTLDCSHVFNTDWRRAGFHFTGETFPTAAVFPCAYCQFGKALTQDEALMVWKQARDDRNNRVDKRRSELLVALSMEELVQLREALAEALPQHPKILVPVDEEIRRRGDV